MNVEIAEFYPLTCDEAKGFLTGTLRIKLPDLGLHILGIFVFKQKDYWRFEIPGRTGRHHQTGEQIRYPFIVFEDRGQQRALIDAIREKGRAFIEKRLTDKENPLMFPVKKQQPTSKAVDQQTSKASFVPARVPVPQTATSQESTPEVKPKARNSPQKPISPKPFDFVDLPPRKISANAKR